MEDLGLMGKYLQSPAQTVKLVFYYKPKLPAFSRMSLLNEVRDYLEHTFGKFSQLFFFLATFLMEVCASKSQQSKCSFATHVH